MQIGYAWITWEEFLDCQWLQVLGLVWVAALIVLLVWMVAEALERDHGFSFKRTFHDFMTGFCRGYLMARKKYPDVWIEVTTDNAVLISCPLWMYGEETRFNFENGERLFVKVWDRAGAPLPLTSKGVK